MQEKKTPKLSVSLRRSQAATRPQAVQGWGESSTAEKELLFSGMGTTSSRVRGKVSSIPRNPSTWRRNASREYPRSERRESVLERL